MTLPDECSFCGAMTEPGQGEFIELMTLDQPENNTGLKAQLARWACKKCIETYKRYLENGEC